MNAVEQAIQLYPTRWWNEGSAIDKQIAFISGYHAAERDLALTVDDIKEIIHIYEITASLLGDELDDDNAQRILNEYERRKRQ